MRCTSCASLEILNPDCSFIQHNPVRNPCPHATHTHTHKVAWGEAGHAVTSRRSPSRALLPVAIKSTVLRSNPEPTPTQGHGQNMRAAPWSVINTQYSLRCTFRHLAFFSYLRVLQRWRMRDMSGGLPVSRPRGIPTCVFHRMPWIMQSPSPAFSTQAAAPPHKHTVHTVRVCTSASLRFFSVAMRGKGDLC